MPWLDSVAVLVGSPRERKKKKKKESQYFTQTDMPTPNNLDT